jgi:ankyrin repeat protein
MEPADDDFISPLHIASLFGSRKHIKKLIKNGADRYINAGNKHKYTPLHIALQVGNFDVADELIAQNADIRVANTLGYQAIHLATLQNHLPLVKKLISKGADVNAQEKDGYTPLHLATCNGSKHMIKLLLESGALLDKETNNGSTALFLALVSPDFNQEIADMLLSKKKEKKE